MALHCKNKDLKNHCNILNILVSLKLLFISLFYLQHVYNVRYFIYLGHRYVCLIGVGDELR